MPESTPVNVYVTTSDGTRKRWRITWLPRGHPDLDGALGRVEGPTVKGKRIFLQTGQTPEELFDSILHELCHAAGWGLAEHWVADFSNDVTRILKRLGYQFDRREP